MLTEEINQELQLPPFPIATKTSTWGQLNAGDCVMQAGSVLTLYSDNHATFQAVVWTNHTHSGDTWRHTINILNAGGGVVFSITLNGPDHMNDDGTHYAFSSSFGLPPGVYDAATNISVVGNC